MGTKKKAGKEVLHPGEKTKEKPHRNCSKQYSKKNIRKTFGQNVRKSDVEIKESTFRQKVQKPDVKTKESTLGQKVQKSEEKTEVSTFGQKVQKSEEMKEKKLRNKKRIREEAKKQRNKKGIVFHKKEPVTFWENSNDTFSKHHAESIYGEKVLKADREKEKNTLGQKVQKPEESKEKERKLRNKKRIREEAKKQRSKKKAEFPEKGNVTFPEAKEAEFPEKSCVIFSEDNHVTFPQRSKDTVSEHNTSMFFERENPAVTPKKNQDFGKKRTMEFFNEEHSEKKEEKKEAGLRKAKKRKEETSKSTEYTLEQVWDAKSGQYRYVAVPKKQKRMFPVNRAGRTTMKNLEYAAGDFIREHTKDEEEDNAAVDGAHGTGRMTERISGWVRGQETFHKSKRNLKTGIFSELEKPESKQEQKVWYEKEQKKALQKRVQKRRIQRTYAKAIRQAVADRNLQEVVLQTKQLTVMAARQIQEAVRKHAGVLAVAGTSLLLLIMIMTSVSSCGAMFADMQSMILAAAYQSEPEEVDAVDLQFTRLELDLQNEIDAIETVHPGYDEYAYNLGEIGHDPFTLISYLSAVHTEFRASGVEAEVEALFGEMYELVLEPTTETRTREVQAKNEIGELLFEEDGTAVMEEEEYEVSILKVTLTVTSLETIVNGKMDMEQKEFYEMYQETGGLLQEFDTPLMLYWYSYVSSYYGYRKNPISGEEQFHRGVDIAVPTGTRVYATHDGMVTEAAYDSHYGNYVVMELEGFVTKYAHMDSLSVQAGQFIEKGTVIGTTGNTGSSTGSHLHIECLYNGEYYNPLFYFEAGTGTIYGEAIDRDPTDVVPPEGYGDALTEILMEEAARYLGYPYVFGGSEPVTGFDCSGFVCWVYTNSGVRELPRTNVRGIYSQCTAVSPSEAKAGDLIFFTGTYGIPGMPSHVGIYCGDGVMIHCGDPIAYASITSSYWQNHFYGFGRLN